MNEKQTEKNLHEGYTLPLWFTNVYIEEILQDYLKGDSIKVICFNVAPATAKGNQYASVILRVTIEYEQNGKNYFKPIILKIRHQDETTAQLLEEYDMHLKEMSFYKRIIPEFHLLLKSIGDKDRLCPNTLTVDHKNHALIFQDLKDSGYELADRKSGVDWSHLNLYIQKISKFHACSVVYKQNTGETFPEFQKGLFHKDATGFDTFWKQNMKTLASEVENWQGFEKYAHKLKKLSDVIVKQGQDIFLRDESQFNVLIHGDTWVANMMFKYDENRKPIDVILIDHQINYFGSFAFDLIYFVSTSTKNDIKFNDFDKVLQLYHQNLQNTLLNLNYQSKIPTLFELKMECVQKSFFEVISIATIFPVIINEREDNADIETLVGTNDVAQAFRNQLYTNETVVKTLKHFLPIWDAKGLLDPL
uniref:CSON013154 protein n=1 Tax=Culicoides sonorensis TaxID=179676 RepID=A0A336MCN0_CULSO